MPSNNQFDINNLALPKGDKGDHGIQGPQGLPGITLISITLIDLATLKNNSNLVAGNYYLTTDWTSGIENLIFFASKNNKLDARAVSDTFQNDVIEVNTSSAFSGAWTIRYRRYIIDEVSAYYDWRSIQFTRWETVAGNGTYTSTSDPGGGAASRLFYTFSNNIQTNANVFTPVANGNATGTVRMHLGYGVTNTIFGTSTSRNIFRDGVSAGNTISNSFINNFIDADFNNNIIAVNCEENKIGQGAFSNTIGTGFKFNVIGSDFAQNIFGNTCEDNVIGNAFFDNDISGGLFYHNRIAGGFYQNEIGVNFDSNIIGTYFYSNVIDANFQNNDIVSLFYENSSIGDSFESNQIGTNFYQNISIGDNFLDNIIGAEFRQNLSIGDSFQSNKTIGLFANNTIGDGCSSNEFGPFTVSNNIEDSFIKNKIFDSFIGNTIGNSFQLNSILAPVSVTNFTFATFVYTSYNKSIVGNSGGALKLFYLDITSTVAQVTSITTGVGINAKKGIITTQSASTAANGSSTFTVTNSSATTTAQIKVWIQNYTGTFSTNGIPVVNVDNTTAGTFDIVISNAHGTNALSGTFKIGFEIVEFSDSTVGIIA